MPFISFLNSQPFLRYKRDSQITNHPVYNCAIDNEAEISAYLADQLRDTPIQISYMTLADCINAVRSSPRTDHYLEAAYNVRPARIEHHDLPIRGQDVDFGPPSIDIRHAANVLEDPAPDITPLE
ncbi:hypothetical protein M8J77_002936 [Diaphorina citri]|nr:hypothetical protein M8J77_002936 [Diaphorina citri]